MIVEYIRYRILEGEADAFEDAYRSAGTSLDASAHCERYEVARCTEDPGAYTVRIEWDSAEGHLQGFRGSPSSAASSRRCDRTSTASRRCATTTSGSSA